MGNTPCTGIVQTVLQYTVVVIRASKIQRYLKFCALIDGLTDGYAQFPIIIIIIIIIIIY